jgi:hypothetical protein
MENLLESVLVTGMRPNAESERFKGYVATALDSTDTNKHFARAEIFGA